jgi:hypothetical protein
MIQPACQNASFNNKIMLVYSLRLLSFVLTASFHLNLSTRSKMCFFLSNKRKRIPKGRSKINNAEKLTT